MKYILLTVLLLSIISPGLSHAQGKHARKLVWADEFSNNGLPDSTKWNYDVGGNGWGNRERQYYTDADSGNVYVKNGKLYITARKQQSGNNDYTAARMVTKGKGDWLYGYIEVRAILPKGRGLWPAIWMLPTDWKYGSWPLSGEIDIMEHVGFTPDSIYGSIHTKNFENSIGTPFTRGISVKQPYTRFHTYAIEWNKDAIVFLIDDKKYAVFKNTGKGFGDWPFNERFHLLLNIAVGGEWGGLQGIDESIFPQSMVVDYVRVYQ